MDCVKKIVKSKVASRHAGLIFGTIGGKKN